MYAVNIAFAIYTALILVYQVFMIRYLTNTKNCDRLSQQDATFRQVALVITYIGAALTGLTLLGTIILIIAQISGSATANELALNVRDFGDQIRM